MATQYTQRFRDFDAEFVARGTDRQRMAVFKIIDGEEQLMPKMTFPGCLKFMPYAEALSPLEQTEI